MTDETRAWGIMTPPEIPEDGVPSVGPLPTFEWQEGDPDLEAMQGGVDGLIERLPVTIGDAMEPGPPIDVFVNEEGRLRGMEPSVVVLGRVGDEPNPWNIVCGPVVLAAHDRYGNSRGLTEEERRGIRFDPEDRLVISNRWVVPILYLNQGEALV